MRTIVYLLLVIAGFVMMLAAACDYILNVGSFDTYVFVLGVALFVAGYVLTMKLVRDADSEGGRKGE